MDFLGKEQSPLNFEEWDQLEKAIIDVAKKDACMQKVYACGWPNRCGPSGDIL